MKRLLGKAGCFFRGIRWRFMGYRVSGHEFLWYKEYRVIDGIATVNDIKVCKDCGKKFNDLFTKQTEEGLK